MNIIERIDRPCEYVEVAQTALIACQYLYLWLFAGPDDAYKVYSLAILMAFEFVMVHSGLFMAAMPLKASIRLFIPLYGLFAFAFGHSMREGDYTIIILYLATVLNRMRFAFFNVSKSVKQRVVRQSMIALAVYFVLTVSVVRGLFVICYFCSRISAQFHSFLIGDILFRYCLCLIFSVSPLPAFRIHRVGCSFSAWRCCFC